MADNITEGLPQDDLAPDGATRQPDTQPQKRSQPGPESNSGASEERPTPHTPRVEKRLRELSPEEEESQRREQERVQRISLDRAAADQGVDLGLSSRMTNDSLSALLGGMTKGERPTPKQLVKQAYNYFKEDPRAHEAAWKERISRATDQDKTKLIDANEQEFMTNYVAIKELAKQLSQHPPVDFTKGEIELLEEFANFKPGELRTDEEKRAMVNNLLNKTKLGSSAFYEHISNQQLNSSYPDTVESLMEYTMDFESEEYNVGGKYELMNVHGEVQLQNFLRWIRSRMLYYHTLSPDSEMDFTQGITVFAQFNRLTLADLIASDRFWRKRTYIGRKVTNVPVSQTEDGEYIYAQREQEAFEPRNEPKYQSFRENILMEAYLFQSSRNLDAKYRSIMDNENELFKFLSGSFTFNVFSQDENRMQLTWRLSASTKEDLAWLGDGYYPKKEGQLGKGVRHSDVLYYHMGEIENKDQVDNAFFQALGPEGRSNFYNAIIKRSLQKNMTNADTTLTKFMGFANEFDGNTEAGGIKRSDFLQILTTKGKPGREMLIQQYIDKDFQEILSTRDYVKKQKLMFEYLKNKDRGGLSGVLSKKLAQDQVLNFESDPIALDKFFQQLEQNVKETVTELASVDKDKLKQALQKTGWSSRQLDAIDRIREDPEELALLMVYHFQASYDKKTAMVDGSGVVNPEEVRKYINLFNANNKPKALIALVRGAITDTMSKEYSLDAQEADYAESIAYSKVRWTGSAARNDTTATAFDAWTKLLRFKEYRLGQKGKNDIGSLYNINGLQRLNVTYWEALNGTHTDANGQSRKMLLLEAMQGSSGDVSYKALKSEVKQLNIDYNLERSYGSNHIGKGFELYQYLLYQVDAGFDELIKYDNYGQASVDHKKMADLWNKTYKAIRYTFNQMDFPFETEIRDVYQDYSRKPAKGKGSIFGRKITREHGRLEFRPEIKQETIFKTRKLKESMFDDEIINMGLYDRDIAVLDKAWKKGPNGDRLYLKEYSRNILGYLIAKEVEANRDPHNPDHPRQWTINEIELLRQYFNNYALEIDPTAASRSGQKGRYKRVRVQSGFFNNNEMIKIFGMAKSRKRILWWGIFWRLLMGTFFTAATSSFSQAGKVKLS